MIYLDSAATSYYRPKQVAEAVAKAIETMGNCSRGTHGASLTTARVIYETRGLIAGLFNVDGAERVAFTANSTESLNIAINGTLNSGDHVITTVLEHNSVLRPLYRLEKQGVALTIAHCDDKGNLNYDALFGAVKANTRAIICTHASNLIGNKVDIRRIGAFCREKGILFIVDASQTAGVFPIDMQRDFIDILCFTGHKGLLGPQGTGGICVRKGVDIRPLIVGGSGILTYSKTHPDAMPESLEAGTLNGHGIAGLRAALLYINSVGMEAIRQTEQQLAQAFYDSINDIPKIKIYGDFTDFDRAAVVALNLGDEDSGAVSDELSESFGIYTRAGGHCAPLMHKALGTENQGAVRFSFSSFNTLDDVKAASAALRELSERL